MFLFKFTRSVLIVDCILFSAQAVVAGFLEKFDNGELNKANAADCIGKENCGAAKSSSPYSNELKAQIRLSFEKEGGYYLELMDGVIQNGWSVLKGD